MKKIVIANLMRAKNKQSFFALHQIHTKIKTLHSDAQIEFHILWDNVHELGTTKNEDKYWADLIDNFGFQIFPYTIDFFKWEYCKRIYGIRNSFINQFDKFKAIYLMLLPHYLRRSWLYDYYLIYDDDILINDDFSEITDLLINKTPFVMWEPYNSSCDKIMFRTLVEIYGTEFIETYKKHNPALYGFNSGFQAMDLAIYDDFLSVDRFSTFLEMFDYSGIYDEGGNEIRGNKRLIIDTQQQSFMSLMNIVRSRVAPVILDIHKYYIAPDWSNFEHPIFGNIDRDDGYNGWGLCLKSKISHFIGHTQGKGKCRVFLDRIDMYLKENGFIK
jgi:hypothetical protein